MQGHIHLINHQTDVLLSDGDSQLLVPAQHKGISEFARTRCNF